MGTPPQIFLISLTQGRKIIYNQGGFTDPVKMTRLVPSPDPPKNPRRLHRAPSRLLRWLVEPEASFSSQEQRRSRWLAWLIISLFLLSILAFVLVLISSRTTHPAQGEYALLAAGVAILLAGAFSLNHGGHYPAAAWLTVAGTVLGTWGSALLDPKSWIGNSLPTVFPVLSILICGLLLSATATLLLSVAEILTLGLTSYFDTALASIHWPWILVFVIIASGLAVLLSVWIREDLEQIERQDRQLAESEALLREQSVRDPLTGLFTRRYLEETLERELRRSERDHSPLGVIMLDIDHFKEFNDAHGRSAGDALLLQIGLLLRAHIRSADFACRFGGEEFMVVLPEAPREVTRERAALLLENARRIHAQQDGRTLGGVTLSLGVVFYPDHGTTRVTILRAVGDALFRAKKDGGDQLVVAE